MPCRWLGNPTADAQQQSVRCWDDAASIVIIVTDNCPCVTTNVVTGAQIGTNVNPPCCGDIYHMCARSTLKEGRNNHMFSSHLGLIR